ncbi:T9SS type A sorting domain-containing protein [Hymenobacter sp. BT770]|uniref:T9SS type A sorting domain-containing protein n=1 Tax=Hymenobacter sp. BT770 TaxID=2886942 RepID=UPI001D1063A4|nr:T9SS type A sorting domain-containing protein [Hymenobacter sp. BT770]MCC3154363.1 T9SS type A sorting domain-containing protein [Hymenobacter sp. BT770]MDO3415684.1 T9SS type A sorting domain-containing protein [Hymenobacter sp. BT770]
MINPYSLEIWTRRLQRFGLAALLAGGTTVAAQAQLLNYSTATATNVTGTYTDLATVASSAVIATANTDNANSAAQNIGFSFSYNGGTFTQFVLNTNGIMRLGSAAPSVANLFAAYEAGQAAGVDPITSPSAADVNLLAPFNFDLEDGSAGTAEYRVATTGTAPNRVCTIQWKNVRDKAGTTNATQFDNFEFQVRLYETTNLIEFGYGNTVSATAGASINRFPTVGIKGSGSNSGQDILVNKTSSTAAWSTAVFITGVYASSTLNYRRLAPPDLGRTFRFATAPANDAAVTIVYTLGKIASPTALPHAVKAVVTNAGTTTQTNLAVTLNVTGANTFTDTKTVASLAAGASTTVTFADYPAALTAGTNTVTVTVPADANNANNIVAYGQLVTADRTSYTDPAVPATGGVGIGTGNAVLATKYTLPAASVISDVVLTFAAAGTSGNSAPYQVVIYDASGTGGLPGQVLYTSATQNRTSAGGAVTVTVPSVAVPAAFFIGVKETSTANIAISYQTENPIRPGTFYYTTDGSVWNDFINVTPKARVAIEFGTVVPTCTPPTALAASNVTATDATIAFTAPASGAANYEILYGPTGFNTVSGGTLVTTSTSPVTLTGLSPATTYQVYVRSNCTAGGTSIYATPISFTTLCNPNPSVAAFPYNQNFDTILAGQVLPCGFTTLNANNDNTTWAITKTNPNSGANAIRYTGLTLNNVAADDWFFTPPLTLAATSRYQLAFRYRGEGIVNSPSSYTESLEVKSGSAATAAAQTNLLYTNAAITNTSYLLADGASTPVVALLPAGASTQYVGFHIKSAANQGNLYIDDLSITATAVTANSEALLRAISVFPNPSTTGQFDLEIHGANAKGSLAVLVTNALGQRVYTGSARDNYSNKLNLSSLAPGIYYLQVRHGNEQMTSRVSIVK